MILKKMNLSVPDIIAYDISKGFFVIEDFGLNTYTYFVYSSCILMKLNFESKSFPR